MKIELLYFEGCPTRGPALERLTELLAEAGVAQKIELITISTQADAERHRFLGSPTVRIDGEDMDPSVWGRTEFGFGCRLYQHAGAVISGVPPKEMIRQALRRRAGAVAQSPSLTRVTDIEDAQGEVLAAIQRQHPDWVQANGQCPHCVSYEYELAGPANPPQEE